MDIRDLLYLEASAAAGNFTHAAKSLGISTSTISRRVGRLEDELGLAVFSRGRGGVCLTPGGKAVMLHLRRALAEFNEIRQAGDRHGNGIIGEVRLAVRMPPVGEPLVGLLRRWRSEHPDVCLTVSEMEEREIRAAIRESRVDVALMTRHALWPEAVTAPLYREPILVAIPCRHPLAKHGTIDWRRLQNETVLVQGWDNSQSARQFYGSLMGSGARFEGHAASKQSILALVAAGFGITLATRSQAEVSFPGVAYRPIGEENAWLQVELVWNPDAEDPAVGRFVAFMRDEARSRRLF